MISPNDINDIVDDLTCGIEGVVPPEILLRCRGLRVQNKEEVVLYGLDLEVHKGEVVVLALDSEWAARMVPRIIIGVNPADAGEIEIGGTRLSELSELKKIELRRKIGYLFHHSGLIQNLTIWYNVALPALYHSRFKDLQGVGKHVDVLIERCGLTELKNLRPAVLDGSTCMKVALARSWVMSPPLLIFEDPEMDIDTRSGGDMLKLAFDVTPPEWENRDPRPADPGVLITSQGLHEELLKYVDRIIIIKGGEVAFAGTPEEYDRFGNGHSGDLKNTRERSSES